MHNYVFLCSCFASLKGTAQASVLRTRGIIQDSVLHWPLASSIRTHPFPGHAAQTLHACNTRGHFSSIICASSSSPSASAGHVATSERIWEDEGNTWAAAAHKTIQGASMYSSPHADWTFKMAQRANGEAHLARKVAEEAVAKNLRRVAASWFAAATAWELAAEALEKAITHSWTSATSRTLVVASKATAEAGAAIWEATVEHIGSQVVMWEVRAIQEVVGAWARAAAIWEAVAEYKESQEKGRGASGLDAQMYPNVIDMTAILLIGLFVGCSVSFAIVHFRHHSSTTSDEPLLRATS